ncbi:hypothetical protein FQR65_LT18573 [Abscondita terminalis]|nr:hypothetical protein FQR65_LT18573 [Abscondita terminalis]
MTYNDTLTNGNLIINGDQLNSLEINPNTGNLILSNEQYNRMKIDFNKIVNLEALRIFINDSFQKDYNYSKVKKFIPNKIINSIEIIQENVLLKKISQDGKNLELTIPSRVHYQYFDLNKTLQTKSTSPISITIKIASNEVVKDVLLEFTNGIFENLFYGFAGGQNNSNLALDVKQKKYKKPGASFFGTEYLIKFIRDNIMDSSKMDIIKNVTTKKNLDSADAYLQKAQTEFAYKIYTVDTVNEHIIDVKNFMQSHSPKNFILDEKYYKNPISYNVVGVEGIALDQKYTPTETITFQMDPVELPILLYLSLKEVPNNNEYFLHFNRCRLTDLSRKYAGTKDGDVVISPNYLFKQGGFLGADTSVPKEMREVFKELNLIVYESSYLTQSDLKIDNDTNLLENKLYPVAGTVPSDNNYILESGTKGIQPYMNMTFEIKNIIKVNLSISKEYLSKYSKNGIVMSKLTATDVPSC